MKSIDAPKLLALVGRRIFVPSPGSTWLTEGRLNFASSPRRAALHPTTLSAQNFVDHPVALHGKAKHEGVTFQFHRQCPPTRRRQFEDLVQQRIVHAGKTQIRGQILQRISLPMSKIDGAGQDYWFRFSTPHIHEFPGPPVESVCDRSCTHHLDLVPKQRSQPHSQS